ncbi:MAG TPA: hypothetical protein VF275_03000 [Gammaproteobacteria bacterium]
MRLFIASVLLCSVHIAIAGAPPHTFTAGTPARASEVNDNFKYLAGEVDRVDGEVDALSDKLSVLESDVIDLKGSSCTPLNEAHSLEVTTSPLPVGTEIQLDGETFHIVRIRFTDFGSGEAYALTFPAQDTNTLWTSVDFYHRPGMFYCPTHEISGFPATINFWEQRTFSLMPDTNRAEMNLSARSTIEIQVGETTVTYYYGPGDSRLEEGTDYTPGVTDLDFVDDFSDHPHPDLIVEAVDDFVDYFSVEKL